MIPISGENVGKLSYTYLLELKTVAQNNVSLEGLAMSSLKDQGRNSHNFVGLAI